MYIWSLAKMNCYTHPRCRQSAAFCHFWQRFTLGTILNARRFGLFCIAAKFFQRNQSSLLYNLSNTDKCNRNSWPSKPPINLVNLCVLMCSLITIPILRRCRCLDFVALCGKDFDVFSSSSSFQTIRDNYYAYSVCQWCKSWALSISKTLL